jgi:high-affinity Fe2+/Pb2+ permease
MDKKVQKREQAQSNTSTIYAVGGILGALVGLIAAFIVIKNYESGGDKEFNAGTGVKLGLAVMGLLRILAG